MKWSTPCETERQARLASHRPSLVKLFLRESSAKQRVTKLLLNVEELSMHCADGSNQARIKDDSLELTAAELQKLVYVQRHSHTSSAYRKSGHS